MAVGAARGAASFCASATERGAAAPAGRGSGVPAAVTYAQQTQCRIWCCFLLEIVLSQQQIPVKKKNPACACRAVCAMLQALSHGPYKQRSPTKSDPLFPSSVKVLFSHLLTLLSSSAVSSCFIPVPEKLTVISELH